MTTKHTPTPWNLTEIIDWVGVKDKNGRHVLGYDTSNGNEIYSNIAAHIVKCVNEHDQLQEKLKVAVEALEIIKSTEKGRVALISLQALATIKDSNLTKKKEV